jgi:hypothetical protein
MTTPPTASVPAPPVTAMPVTQIAPVFAPAPPPRQCGLARFFGSLWGTNYQTTYYRAPVTYYRPVTTIDPVSGMAVTVQQPCTSYEQQLQRTPYVSPQPGQRAPAPPQPTGSACDSYSARPYPAAPGVQTWPPTSSTGIGQVGGVSPIGQPPVIPSTSNGLTPLTGSPPMSRAPTTGDLAPVNQPELQNAAPAQSIDSRRQSPDSKPPSDDSESSSEPRSHWQLQGAADSTAMIRSRTPDHRDAVPDPLMASSPRANPIQAPNDYVAPFPKKDDPPASATPPTLTQPKIEAPQLPARTYDPSEFTSTDDRTEIVVREAALIRARKVQRSPSVSQQRSVSKRPIKRETKWYTISQ